MPRTTVARSRHLPRSPTFSTTDGQRCNQDCLIEFVPVLRREKSMMGTSVVLQGLHVMNQSTTGGSVRMERAFFQIWNWASSKKSTLHIARSRHLLTILWHFFPLAMFANFPGPPVQKWIYLQFASHLLPFSLYICPITLFRNSSLDIVRDWPLSVYLREGQSTSIQSALFPHLHLTDITLLVIAILIEINPHHHHIGFQLQLTLTNLLLVRFPYLFHLLRVIACTVSVN